MFTINQSLGIGAVIFLLILFPLLVMAGTTGKIAGVVEDEKTGDPIPGATIRVLGTDIITETDIDGEYFIINLPAGTYNIAVSIIGFQQIEKENVRVLLDLTTPVDFEVSQVELPLERKLKVYAERQPIQKDMTASRATMTSDRIMNMPNAITAASILSNMAGTVVGNDNRLHLRGGRAGTISYFYDGFSVQDPFTGNLGINIIPEALEEINMTSGGFPAEYGEALSGVVNAVTKEGTNSFRGKIKIYDGATHQYDVNSGDWGKLTRNNNNGMGFVLSGPLPHYLGKRASFFTAGELIVDDGSLPHNAHRIYSQTAKFSFQPTPNLKIAALGSFSHDKGEVYNHTNVNGYSYDFNLDGLGMFRNKSQLYGFQGNYNLNTKSVWSFAVNHFYTQRKVAPDELFDTYWDQWPGYSVDSNGVYNGTIDDDNMQLSEEYFNTGYTSGEDFEPYYNKRSTTYNSFISTFTSQINKHHQLRFGSEYRKYRLFWDDKQFYNVQPYGEKYINTPVYATIYAQDKIEFNDLIINAGLRWDYLHSQVDYFPDVFHTDTEPEIESKSKSQISPRLGFSHPISSNTVIRFNYGYFFQTPAFTYMYQNLDADITTGLPLIGNPDLTPEKTIAYELGINHMLTEDIRIDATVFYKDIKNLVSTRQIFDEEDDQVSSYAIVTKFTNDDYGSAKGLDLTIEKVARGYFSGLLNYSYLIAKGNTSSPYDAYYNYIGSTTDSVVPVKEYPLAYDQRHTLTFSLDYRVPRDWKGDLFGINIPGAWGLNFAGRYGSGLPYTITGDKGNNLEYNVNDGRMPPTYSFDIRFNKDWFLQNNMFFSFFCEIENLFNRKNIINVYGNTGEPDDLGPREAFDPDGEGPYTAEDVQRLYTLYAKDPQNYSAPRTIRLGVEFNF